MNTNTAPIAAETPATVNPDATPGNQPTTPAQLQDVNLTTLLAQKPSFETLKALGLAKLTNLAGENVKALKNVKTSQDKLKRTAKGVGKILAAMKVTYVDAQTAGTLSRDTGFDDYHKKVTGEKPWNHALQCARVFAELVLTARLDEKRYDDRAADWHQHASVILGIIKENKGDLNSPEVAELVDILKNAADDEGAKQLRAMKARLKGTDTAEPGDETVLTVADLRNADVLIRRVCQTDYEASGHKTAGIVLVANILAEYVKSEKREDALRAVFNAVNSAVESMDPDLVAKFIAASSVTPAPQPQAA